MTDYEPTSEKRIARLNEIAQRLGWESFQDAPRVVQNNIEGSLDDGITVADESTEWFDQLAEHF